MRIILVTWRPRKRLLEFSGGVTRLMFLYNVIKRIINHSEINDFALEDVDTKISKIIASMARYSISSSLKITLREYRFYFVNCNKIIKEISKSKEKTVLILDHIRSILMIKKCINEILQYKPITIHISHDYSAEFPYNLTILSSLNKLALSLLNKLNPLIITVSERDKVLYEENAKVNNVIVFPNIYPVLDNNLNVIDYEVKKNNDELIINIVKPIIDKGYLIILNKFIKLLDKYYTSNYPIKLRIISSNTPLFFEKVSKLKIQVELRSNILDRLEYLKYLSQGHVGLIELYADRSSGTNVRRYDYALAATVPFLHHMTVQGEPLLREWSFKDIYDLITKLSFFTPKELYSYGLENKDFITNVFKQYFNELIKALKLLLN